MTFKRILSFIIVEFQFSPPTRVSLGLSVGLPQLPFAVSFFISEKKEAPRGGEEILLERDAISLSSSVKGGGAPVPGSRRAAHTGLASAEVSSFASRFTPQVAGLFSYKGTLVCAGDGTLGVLHSAASASGSGLRWLVRGQLTLGFVFSCKGPSFL